MNINKQNKCLKTISCRHAQAPFSEQVNFSDKEATLKDGIKSVTGKIGIFVALAILLLTLVSCQTSTTDNGQTGDGTSTTTAGQEPSDTSEPEASSPESSDEHGQGPDDAVFTFSWQNQIIALHQSAAPVIADLGEPLNYFEAESCAFEGIDKIYTYGSIEISTVPFNGEDTISQIVLLDDTAETKEGLFIGAGKDAMIEAYGDQFDVVGDGFIYTKEDTQLLVIIEDDVIVAIEYIAVFD